VRWAGAGFYVGFPRLNQMRFIARDPILAWILGHRGTDAPIDAVAVSREITSERGATDSQDSAGVSNAPDEFLS
jgi:hypothetical protein